MRRGYAMLLDAAVALTFTLIILYSLIGMQYTGSSGSDASMRRLHYVSEDVLDVMNKQGILDQVGEEWAAADGNKSSPHYINATILANESIRPLLPQNIGYMLTIDDDPVVNDSETPQDISDSLTHSTRLLVGYGKGLPTRGNVARAFLTSIKGKQASAYTFFGGRVGLGNITVDVKDVPQDNTNILKYCLELNTNSSFNLKIDGQAAGTYNIIASPQMKPNVVEGENDADQIQCCVNSTSYPLSDQGSDGILRFEITFTNPDIKDHYVNGGYAHVRYNTSEMDTKPISKYMEKNLPGIKGGVIDLRDSFYVPGAIKDMNVHLHFKSKPQVYFNIANVTVYNSTDGDSSEQVVDIPNPVGLYYEPVEDASSLSGKTVPIMMGTYNYTELAEAGYTEAELYPDSYIEFTYDTANKSYYGMVSLTEATGRFDNPMDPCEGNISTPPGVTLSDVEVLSYSGPHWTDYVDLGGVAVYNLPGSWSSENYSMLGNPSAVNIPPEYVTPGGTNIVKVRTGNTTKASQGCTTYNKGVYTMRVKTLVGYGDVYQKMEGCKWDIEFEDGSPLTGERIPASYAGNDTCNYTSYSIAYAKDDAMKDAVYRLFYELDFDKDGEVDLLFDQTMIDFEIGQAGGVQSLWGPARFKLVVWI
ncbi:MAG: hypothetical protein V1744_01460 [Candidatus Altiarchaeota archaeon]